MIATLAKTLPAMADLTAAPRTVRRQVESPQLIFIIPPCPLQQPSLAVCSRILRERYIRRYITRVVNMSAALAQTNGGVCGLSVTLGRSVGAALVRARRLLPVRWPARNCPALGTSWASAVRTS